MSFRNGRMFAGKLLSEHVQNDRNPKQQLRSMLVENVAFITATFFLLFPFSLLFHCLRNDTAAAHRSDAIASSKTQFNIRSVSCFALMAFFSLIPCRTGRLRLGSSMVVLNLRFRPTTRRRERCRGCAEVPKFKRISLVQPIVLEGAAFYGTPALLPLSICRLFFRGRFQIESLFYGFHGLMGEIKCQILWLNFGFSCDKGSKDEAKSHAPMPTR